MFAGGVKRSSISPSLADEYPTPTVPIPDESGRISQRSYPYNQTL